MILAFKIAIIITVFVNLCEPGMIFSFYGKLIDRLPGWLYNPLGGCVKCTTGQACFWGYIIAYFHSYNLFEHILFISSGIILSLIIDKLWNLCET
jgi:hypothetical protein